MTVVLALGEGSSLAAQVWLAQVGRVPLLLLDSYVEQNDPGLREVTDRLYGGGSEHRLRQELLLGMGGVRAVRAYCELTGHPQPEVFHTNEGHAGFLGLERIREYAAQGLSFEEAIELCRAGTVFTTHTPVPAGIDRFARDLVERQFGGDAADPALPLRPGPRPGRGNLPGRGPGRVQHGRDGHAPGPAGERGEQAARPGQPGDVRGPVARVRNQRGADRLDHQRRARRQLGGAGDHGAGRPAARQSGPELPEAGLVWDRWPRPARPGCGTSAACCAAAWSLEARQRLRASLRQRGHSEAELGWTHHALDEFVLTIGFARRVPSYKRLTLMLHDPERLTALLLDPQRPVQIVIAGKAHPADDGGKQLIQQMVRFADDPRVRHRILFLPDYDMALAAAMVQGCDVWLNNPLRPLEACGTSGMKAALNGGLNLSVRDGWWDEWFDGENGWAIPSADDVADAGRRDELESATLYDLLEQVVAPLFYETGADGLPHRWLEMVAHTFAGLGPRAQAARMVREYVETLYVPAARASRALADAPGQAPFAAARDLAAWKHRVRAAWADVKDRAHRGGRRGTRPGGVAAGPGERGPGRAVAGGRHGRGRLRPGDRRGGHRRAEAHPMTPSGASRSVKAPSATPGRRGWAGRDRSGTRCAWCPATRCWPAPPSWAWSPTPTPPRG